MLNDVESEVSTLRKILDELSGLVVAGIDDTCEFGTDIARKCSLFAADVGGVLVADLKSAAEKLGIVVDWVIPTISQLTILVEDMLQKLLPPRNIVAEKFATAR